ncbi:Beta-phosphoglucomutase [Methanosarcina siciliae HI350]|uniref:Beta-phosphoglucomutase n=2 Tax=Methanosarcina siciliae TaxID=38027 RepID=A0A0E3LAG0_9EURY|nr:Beta-phosphoglucomutase [Methanosarcina siciliae HI350]
MDGVLVDSMRFQADAWITVFRECGIAINRRDIYILEGSNNRGIIETIFKNARKTPDPWHFEYLANKKREILDFENIVPFDGIQNCIGELKKDFKLATVSGSGRYMVEKVVNTFFSKCFKIIITGDDFKHGKPDPEPYIKALEKLCMNKDECIVVENSPMGISAAKKAGLYCVAVATTLDSEELEDADIIFKDHVALINYLSNLSVNNLNCK